MTRRLLVITEHRRNSRAPADNMNWEAVTDNYDGPGSPMGLGATEANAVADLYHQINEREDAEASMWVWEERDPDLRGQS